VTYPTEANPVLQWDAYDFYTNGLCGVINPDLLWYSICWLCGAAEELTEDAQIYEKGCWGLVILRTGHDPYSSDNFFFTSLDDAMKKARALGDNARIFAIQYDGKPGWKAAGAPDYPSQVSIGERHSEGNHATWHQVADGHGYWEYLGPDGWASDPNEDFDSGAKKRYVWHVLHLPKYDNTVYGVADASDAHFKALSIGKDKLCPTQAPKKGD